MTDKETFDFMLKEYELLYSKFEMHYGAVEKTIGVYILVIGGILSANGFLTEKLDTFSIFNFSQFQLVCSTFLALLGFFVIMKVIEHRLLIIAYVKSVNLNRKWFVDNARSNPTLYKYMYWEANPEHPKFYKPYRHFFWEVVGLSSINGVFISLSGINLVKMMFVFESEYAEVLNWGYFVILVLVATLLMVLTYKRRGKAEETEMATRAYNR
jgi:hypothetical protein